MQMPMKRKASCSGRQRTQRKRRCAGRSRTERSAEARLHLTPQAAVVTAAGGDDAHDAQQEQIPDRIAAVAEVERNDG